MIDQGLLSLLRTQAALHGMKAVCDTCNAFLKEKVIDREGYEIERKKKIPRPWVLQALDKQRGKCPRCPEPLTVEDVTGDHIIPVAQGGKHHRGNICATHRSCNSAKGSRSLAEDAKYSGVTSTEYLQRTGMK